MNMFDELKNNIDKKTLLKIEQMLKTEEGIKLSEKLKKMDKEKIIKTLNSKDLSKINYNSLNQALQNTDLKDVLNKLNGGN